MMKLVLIYLLIGVFLMWILEVFWDRLEIEDPENGVELGWAMRIEVILLWPVPVIAAILGLIFNDGDNGPTDPGFGT